MTKLEGLEGDQILYPAIDTKINPFVFLWIALDGMLLISADFSSHEPENEQKRKTGLHIIVLLFLFYFFPFP